MRESTATAQWMLKLIQQRNLNKTRIGQLFLDISNRSREHTKRRRRKVVLPTPSIQNHPYQGRAIMAASHCSRQLCRCLSKVQRNSLRVADPSRPIEREESARFCGHPRPFQTANPRWFGWDIKSQVDSSLLQSDESDPVAGRNLQWAVSW